MFLQLPLYGTWSVRLSCILFFLLFRLKKKVKLTPPSCIPQSFYVPFMKTSAWEEGSLSLQVTSEAQLKSHLLLGDSELLGVRDSVTDSRPNVSSPSQRVSPLPCNSQDCRTTGPSGRGALLPRHCHEHRQGTSKVPVNAGLPRPLSVQSQSLWQSAVFATSTQPWELATGASSRPPGAHHQHPMEKKENNLFPFPKNASKEK